MIIHIIDIYGVPALEPKCHPPIARNRDRKMALHVALEPVQPKAGQVYSFRPATSVQYRQDTRQLCDMARRDLRRASVFIKRFQAAMAERFDHFSSVRCRSTDVNSLLLAQAKWPCASFRVS